MTDYKTESKWKCFLYRLCYKRKLMVNIAAVQLRRVMDALGRFAILIRFFHASQPPACTHNSMAAHCTFTIS